MKRRNTYTVIVPGQYLINSHSANRIARTQNLYFDTKKELLTACAHLSLRGFGKLYIAVHEYVNFGRGLAGCGKILNLATYTNENGLVFHGLTHESAAQLLRYIPQAA